MPPTNDFVHVLFCQRRLSDIGGNNVILSDLRLQLTNKKVYKKCHINFAHCFTGVESLSHSTYSCCVYLKAQSKSKKIILILISVANSFLQIFNGRKKFPLCQSFLFQPSITQANGTWPVFLHLNGTLAFICGLLILVLKDSELLPLCLLSKWRNYEECLHVYRWF